MKYSSIHLSSLLHNDRPGYIKAGYGARPISEWPFYEFIRLYIHGYEQQCVDQWTKWLVQQFSEFQTTPKEQGGMFQGSVHRHAAEQSRIEISTVLQKPELLSEDEVSKGAKHLIHQRLKMVESIKEQGYRIENGDPILAVRKRGKIVLWGGHHRAATLYALGYQKLPGVFICSRYQWRLRQCLTTTKKILNSVQSKIMQTG